MDELKKLQAVFQTLSDFNRLAIIKLIADKECPVGEIVKSSNLSQPLVSHHLKLMKENGFVETKRDGPFIYYYLKDKRLLYALDLFLEIFKDAEFQINPDFKFCSEKMFEMFNQFKRRK